jgi:hypothetical protein
VIKTAACRNLLANGGRIARALSHATIFAEVVVINARNKPDVVGQVKQIAVEVLAKTQQRKRIRSVEDFASTGE